MVNSRYVTNRGWTAATDQPPNRNPSLTGILAMGINTTSRHDALQALVAGAVLGATTGAQGRNAAPSAIDRQAWDAAAAKMISSNAVYDAFIPTLEAAQEAYSKVAPDPKRINFQGIHPYLSREDRHDLLHASDLDAVARDFAAREGKTWAGERFKALHSEAIADLKRFRAEDEAARAAHDIDALEERDEALGEAAYEATWALFRLPAPDLAALRWKIEHLFADATDAGIETTVWAPYVMQNFMADVRRLLRAEA
jgi:hypothetical protein